MNHQKVTAALKNAGMVAQHFLPNRGPLVPGYQVAKIGRSVAILCGTRYSTDEVRRVLEAAGMTVATRPHTASDALFVA